MCSMSADNISVFIGPNSQEGYTSWWVDNLSVCISHFMMQSKYVKKYYTNPSVRCYFKKTNRQLSANSNRRTLENNIYTTQTGDLKINCPHIFIPFWFTNVTDSHKF